MWNENVCRLCLSEKDLFCVLEKRENQNDNLEEIIRITTGVEILKNDVVSRKICENCRKVTIKMLEFRERSQKTDKFLKDRFAENLKKPQVKHPQNDNVVAPTENSVATTSLQNKDASKPNKTRAPTKLDSHKKKRTMDPSIANIFTLNPTIKLPSNILSFNVDPSVWMELDAVENYFIRANLDMKKTVEAVLKSSKGSKKTPVSNKPKESLPDKLVSPINIKKLSDIDSKFEVISKDTIKRKICEKDETTKSDKPSKIKKRRLSSSDSRSDTKTLPPTLMDTLQLKPKENLHICHVCHSVHNNSYTLRKHIKEHFRCKFCKKKFKLSLSKEEHEKTCVVKHMLTSEVYVRLEKIDADPEAIKKYPALNKTEETTESSCTEIIELSDDDDQNAPLELPPEKTVQYFSTGLVRPDIKIKDDKVFHSVDMATSDFGVLKQLLKMNLTADLKISIQEQTQTESPCNGKIVKLPDAGTATLKGLKPQLFAFKVPVRVQKGIFDVGYVTEKTSSVQKHMNLWSNIKPIGLKTIKSTTEKPVQIILNRFISSSNTNTFTGTTATITNNAHASTPTTSTGVGQQHTFYYPRMMVNNTPRTYLQPTGTNNIPRTSTSIISTGQQQQQVFVPNNSGYKNDTSVIVGTNHVSTPSTVTSIPKNNNGTNIYSIDYNVPTEVSSNYAAINNKLPVQTLNSTAVPTNVDNIPRTSTSIISMGQQQQQVFVPNNSGYKNATPVIVGTNHVSTPSTVTSIPKNNNGNNIYVIDYNVLNQVSSNHTDINNKLPVQTLNSTAVPTNVVNQPRQSSNSTAVPTNVNSQPRRQSSNRTALPHNFISQQRQSPNSTVVTSNSISQQRLSPNGMAVPMNFNSYPRQLSNSTAVLPNFVSQPSKSYNSTAVTTNFNIQPRQTSLPPNFVSQQRQSPNSTAVPLNFNSQSMQSSKSTAVPLNFNSQQRQSSTSIAAPSNSISQKILSPNGIAVQLNFNNQTRQSSNSTVVSSNFNSQQKTVVENKTPNTNCNIGTNSLSDLQYSAVGQNYVHSNNNQFTDNGTIRPMIRVKNICDLK